ncbi:MAG TPA: MFS transporter, partial [Candidatus Absconditabacterales bacterium]|nr:MFS transporter [Candidatus Absconditabacterales bacterium]
FFNSYGLGESELFIVQSIYAVTVVLLEIPTGFVSDKYSRKLSISLGLFIASIGYFVYSIGHGFWGFAIAEFLLAVGSCFVSGSDTALLYDTLQQTGKEESFKKNSGLQTSFGNRAEAIGGIIGGFVGTYSLSMPFFIDGVSIFIAFLISLTLFEPKIHKFQEGSDIQQIKSVINYSLKNRKIFWLILFSGFMGAITLSMVWFSQPFLKLNDVPVQYFGIYRAISNLVVGLFGLFAHKVEAYLGSREFMLLLIVVSFVSISFIGLYPTLYMLPLFLIFQFVRGGSRVIVQDELHIQTESKMRATVQSISSMFFRLCFAVFGPISGYVAESYGLGNGMLFMGFILCGICFYIYRQYYFGAKLLQ